MSSGRKYSNQRQQSGSTGTCEVTLFDPDPDKTRFIEQIRTRIEQYSADGYVFTDIKELKAGILMIFQK